MSISQADEKIHEIINFFTLLYGQEAPGFLTLWTRQDKQTRWFAMNNQLPQAALAAFNLAANKDVYFGIGLREKQLGPHKRGEAADVIALPCLWQDVDLVDPAHKQANLPPDVESAKAILAKFPLQYSILIHSGHGVYPGWLFKKLWIFKDDQERKQAQALLRKFNAVMSHFFKEKGYHLDNTSDLARVIRVPGTVNRKTEPVPVQILECYPERRYGFKELYDAIEELYSKLSKAQPPGGGHKAQGTGDYPPARADLILERCAFLRHCRDDAVTLSEPDWYFGLVSVLSRTEEAPEIVHELSSPYPKYDPKETDDKIRHALETGPMTCIGIQEKCGGEYCQGCRWNGKITSPIILGFTPRPPAAEPTQPFPVEALPDCFRGYVEEAAAAVCCPPDFVATPLLTCAGAVIGTARRISIKKDWVEPAGLYVATVGDPASKKSPGLEKATRFINELAERLIAEHEDRIREYEHELAAYEVEVQRWKDDVKRAAKGKIPPPGEKPEKPQEPPMPRIFTVDSTVEGLSELMEQNPRGIAIIRDELAGWVKSLNQYKGGKGADRQFFLSCWSGAPAHVDRKGKKPIVLPRTFLAVVGCIPPDILTDLRDEQNRADGFMDRILFSFPEPISQKFTSEEISEAAIQKARECFQGLLKLEHNPGGAPVNLALSEEAREIFIKWHDQHYAELDDPNFPDILRGPWGKMPGQCARLTLIIHCCRQVTESVGNLIDKRSILSGIVLAEYFKNHAKKVYGAVEKTFADKKVEKLMNWIKKQDKREISIRDVITYRIAGCKNASEARDLLNRLKDEGFGFWSETKKNTFLIL